MKNRNQLLVVILLAITISVIISFFAYDNKQKFTNRTALLGKRVGTKTVGEGTELGLSITKGILDEYNSSINILKNVPNIIFEVRFLKSGVINYVT